MDRIDWQAPSANELALMQSPAIARRILVIDLEATCEDGDSLAPEDMEIIEIGAVWATTQGSVINTFQAFVRPVLCQQLSAFCRQLTGIEQANVDGAQLFPTISGQQQVSDHKNQTYTSSQSSPECAPHRPPALWPFCT